MSTMLVRLTIPLLAVLALVLAGCASGDGGGGDEIPTQEVPELEVTSTTGGIRGVVVDDAIRPIKGATVTVESTQQSVTTDETGLFAFSGLEEGNYFVKASHPLYDTQQQNVEVVAGVADPKPVKFLLDRVVLENPYITTLKFDGFIVCSTNFVIPQDVPEVGGAGLLSEECGEGVGVPCEVPPPVGCTRQGGQGNNVAQFDFTVGPGTKTVVIEQVWTPTSEAGTGFYSPVSTEWSCLPVCSGNTLIQLQGASPLYGILDNATLEGAGVVPDDTVISVFTWADPGDQPLPLSVLLNQPYQTFVTTFHYLPAPEGWSFVNGDPDPFA
jgi:hypothetical protein